MKQIYIIIGLLVLQSCSLQKQYDKVFHVHIDVSDKEFKIKKGSKVIILPFETKTYIFAETSHLLFGENLDFHFKRRGIKVLKLKNTDRSLQEKSIELEELDDTEANNDTRRHKNSQNHVNILDLDEIAKNNNADYYLSGFVHEAEIGDILDEEHSSGIIVSIYDKKGLERSRAKYQGRIDLSSFSENSYVAEKIADLVIEE